MAQLLDGDHDLVSLLGEAAARWGADGPARLARLLAELADRGMLAGVESETDPPTRAARSPGWPGSSGPASASCPACPGDGRGLPPRRAACCSRRPRSASWR